MARRGVLRLHRRRGHLGLGNKKLRVGLAYTMTKMYGNLTGDPRPRAVLDALEECLS